MNIFSNNQNEKLARNPRLMLEIDGTIYHPLTHAYEPIQDEDDKLKLFVFIKVIVCDECYRLR